MSTLKNYKWSVLTGTIAAVSVVALVVTSHYGLDGGLLFGVIAIASLASFFVLLFEEGEYDPWAMYYSQVPLIEEREARQLPEISLPLDPKDQDRLDRLREKHQFKKRELYEEAKEQVDHPSHYTAYGVELIEITSQMSFCLGNAVKYVVRDGLKSGATKDLEKALKYIELYEKYPPLDNWGSPIGERRVLTGPDFTDNVRTLQEHMLKEGKTYHAIAARYLCDNEPDRAKKFIESAIEERDNVH